MTATGKEIYNIKLKTGDHPLKDSDTPVRITLFGEKGETGMYIDFF